MGEIELEYYDTGTYKYNKDQQNDHTLPHIEIRYLPTTVNTIVIGGFPEYEFFKNSNSSNCIYVYIPLGKHIFEKVE